MRQCLADSFACSQGFDGPQKSSAVLDLNACNSKRCGAPALSMALMHFLKLFEACIGHQKKPCGFQSPALDQPAVRTSTGHIKAEKKLDKVIHMQCRYGSNLAGTGPRSEWGKGANEPETLSLVSLFLFF